MGITPRNQNLKAIRDELQRGQRIIDNGIVRIMQYAGETFVKEAREALNIAPAYRKGDYTDRTANLRSSIGYFVLHNGNIISEGIEGTSEGVQAGYGLLGKIPIRDTYVLVGVAGMEYASYVESKGYNVISSQADLAIVNIERLLEKFRDKLSRKDIDAGFLVSTFAGVRQFRI